MRTTTVNIHDAKTTLSKLVARAERGERIAIARAGKPVAQLGPISGRRQQAVTLDDPLLQVSEYAYDGELAPGAGGIDDDLYGR
jgi:prevent-host-death family protein